MSKFLTELEIENLCSTRDVEHQKRKLTACKVPFLSTADRQIYLKRETLREQMENKPELTIY